MSDLNLTAMSNTLRTMGKQVSEVLNENVGTRDILPDGCEWSCHVVIGADGKPAIECGFVC